MIIVRLQVQILLSLPYGSLAQSGERLIVDQQVMSSKLIGVAISSYDVIGSI